mmetsp:Transcript_91472/g.196112  ORF Transcript_91472/g.196112 Transcript_91472/m.196112 type:complete len:213 (-) Transcript_91472:901-1539(-)
MSLTGTTSKSKPDGPFTNKHSHSPEYSGPIFQRRCWHSATAQDASTVSSNSPRKAKARPRSSASKTWKGPPTSAPRAAAKGGGLEPPAGKPKKASKRGNWSSISKITRRAPGARMACTSAPSSLQAPSRVKAAPVFASHTSKASMTALSLVSNQPRKMRTRCARNVSDSTGSNSGWSGTRLSSTTVFGPKLPLTTTPPSPSDKRCRYSAGSS